MKSTTTNTYTDSSLLIFSWNANGLKNHKDELLLTLQDKRIDILHLPGFRLYHTNYSDNTTHAGAAIYVRSSLTSHPLPKFQTDYIQSCAVSFIVNNIPLTIAAIYYPLKYKISSKQFNLYFNTLGHNLIVGCDINSKHIRWGYQVSNSRGTSLLHSITTKNLRIISPPNLTYWPTSPGKRPDILDIFVKFPTHFILQL
jgi:hypothetical protein